MINVTGCGILIWHEGLHSIKTKHGKKLVQFKQDGMLSVIEYHSLLSGYSSEGVITESLHRLDGALVIVIESDRGLTTGMQAVDYGCCVMQFTASILHPVLVEAAERRVVITERWRVSCHWVFACHHSFRQLVSSCRHLPLHLSHLPLHSQ